VNVEDARAFANAWVEAWNAHDLEWILGHFSEQVIFTSPVAVQVVADSGGVIRGKRELREYWREGLRLIPDLHFEITGIYVGVETVVINYRNQSGGFVNEVLVFEGSVVARGYGTYFDDGTSPMTPTGTD
jgi:hypothetical protein